ncbi:MAG: substrate-binding domain-containing protein [Chitinophagaceae bacterium]|nr:substrate-binding domain-containing protein [Chitinophagaceae bacterium]
MSKLAMMQYWKKLNIFLCSSLLFAACGEDKTPKVTDTLTSGALTISVDETYKPVMEQEVKVFMSNYPEAKVSVQYKPEAEAIKDYLEGKVKLVVVSRELTEAEKNYCLETKNVPSSLVLAKDAIAVVLAKDAKDTLFSKTQLKGIIGGQFAKKYTVVFDNAGSSTLKYITDSLMRGEPVGKDIYAAKSNEAVIDYVVKNPSAIGFVGLSYISDTIDSTAERFTTHVKIAGIMNDSLQQFYQPYQADIALKHYPLVRKMTYIKNETYPGLATGFSNFLASDVGQLILGKARLVPMRMSLVIREAAINTETNQQ